MNCKLQLATESTTGPLTTVDLPVDRAEQIAAARAWAAGQIGWPWDLILVETEDDSYEISLP